MPAGTYTYVLYNISGSANGTFTVVSSFEVTIYDSDDNFGVGDDQTANQGVSETGAAPVIQSLGPGAPADWNVGDSFYFAGTRGLDGTGGPDDIYVPKVDGAWQTTTAVFNVPNTSVNLTVGGTYSMTGNGGNVEVETLPCFAEKTLILTPDGEVPVEELEVGQLVTTLDHGARPICWIGSCTRFATAQFAPISFQAGAVGNARELKVSPQHRILISGWQAELLFGETEVLVPAKSLLTDHSISRQTGGMFTYYHFMFDQHEIVFSDGAATESFFPGATILEGMEHATRKEIFALFPSLSPYDTTAFGNSARPCLTGNEAAVLCQLMS